MKKKRPVSCEVLFVALLLLLAGCRAGLETGGSAGLLDESMPAAETELPEETEAEAIREMGKDLFQFLFSLRSGETWQGDFVVTNEEGQMLWAIDGKPYGTMDAHIFGDMATTKKQRVKMCSPLYQQLCPGGGRICL